MANRLYKTASGTYVPAVPANPGSPAYCVTEIRYTTAHDLGALLGAAPSDGSGRSGGTVSWQPDGSNGSTINYDAGGTVGWNTPGQLGAGSSSSWQSQYAPTAYRVTTCYPGVPATPAIPARIDYSTVAGWNAGARSREPLPANGRFTCRLPRNGAAVMVGLCGPGFRADYSLMSHAILLRPTGYTFVEYGRDVSPEMPGGQGAKLEIRRENTRVRFYLNDALVFTSATPSAGSTYIGALLYSLLDDVDDPQIKELPAPITFLGTLPALRCVASDTASVAYVSGRLPALVLRAQVVTGVPPARLEASLPALRLLAADRPLAYLQGELPTLTLNAKLIRSEAVVSGFSGQIPLLSLRALLRTGSRGRVEATLPALAALVGDRPVNRLVGTLPIRVGMLALAPYMPANELDGSDGAITWDYGQLESALLLVALDGLEASGAIDVSLVMELAALAGLDLTDSATLGEVLLLLAEENVAISGTGQPAQRQALQYATNALTGAMTRYEGFDFLGFTRLNGESYAWTRDGLYRLGADTDNGQLIRALIDFGTTDHGGLQAKRLDTAFIGVRTDGQCYLRVRGDEGEERVYSFVGSADTKRARLAKGVIARHWSYRVELVDASFAEVDAFEVSVGAMRRIYERRG